MPIKRKAVALISGGLDSMLAVRMVQEQDIEVEGINFFTGFCVEGHTHTIRNQDKKKRNGIMPGGWPKSLE
jgi:tRNA-specific 2-thiouridylase